MDLNDDIFEGLTETGADAVHEASVITCTNIAPEAPEEPKEPESKWALRDRLRSRALWAALAGLLITILGAFDVWDAIGITEPELKGILTAIGSLLAAFGVFNDPTERTRF